MPLNKLTIYIFLNGFCTTQYIHMKVSMWRAYLSTWLETYGKDSILEQLAMLGETTSSADYSVFYFLISSDKFIITDPYTMTMIGLLFSQSTLFSISMYLQHIYYHCWLQLKFYLLSVSCYMPSDVYVSFSTQRFQFHNFSSHTMASIQA